MEIINNEQTIKKQSLFLKLEDGDKVVLKSKLIRISTAYIPSFKMSVLWDDRLTEKKRTELFYFAKVNDREGVLRLPLSLLIQMNDTERLIEKDKRSILWVIGKTGKGLETKYNAIQMGEVKVNEKEIEENTEKLKNILMEYEKTLRFNLEKYLKNKEGEAFDKEEFDLEKYLKDKKEEKPKEEEEPEEVGTEQVDPDEIPF